MKPISEACDRNKDPILNVLKEEFAHCRTVLEIGSGTGQHAVYFGAALPHLIWQTSDLLENHRGILAWIDEAKLPNVLRPLSLNVTDPVWPVDKVDAIFSANTAHIMGLEEVPYLFKGVSRHLDSGGFFALYGPFHYGGKPTSASNAYFDQYLRSQNPESGVRHFEALNDLALENGLILHRDESLPSNNHLLIWEKT